MKANSVPTEELLRGISREQWGLAWEAIMDATQKDIDFPTQGTIYAYIKTYIYRKEFNDTYYHKRTKVVDEDGNESTKHEYIMKSLPVTSAIAIYGVHSNTDNEEYEHGYDSMIAGVTASCSDYAYEEIELSIELSAMGIPKYFIERILSGERIVESRLSKEEIPYLNRCREAFTGLRARA